MIDGFDSIRRMVFSFVLFELSAPGKRTEKKLAAASEKVISSTRIKNIDICTPTLSHNLYSNKASDADFP